MLEGLSSGGHFQSRFHLLSDIKDQRELLFSSMPQIFAE